MIYFIQAGANGPVKIGHTKFDPKRRLIALQTAHYERLHILKCVDGDESYEKELHQRFGADKILYEWFSPSPALTTFIAAQPNSDRYGEPKPSFRFELRLATSAIDSIDWMSKQTGAGSRAKVIRDAIQYYHTLLGLDDQLE